MKSPDRHNKSKENWNIPQSSCTELLATNSSTIVKNAHSVCSIIDRFIHISTRSTRKYTNSILSFRRAVGALQSVDLWPKLWQINYAIARALCFYVFILEWLQVLERSQNKLINGSVRVVAVKINGVKLNEKKDSGESCRPQNIFISADCSYLSSLETQFNIMHATWKIMMMNPENMWISFDQREVKLTSPLHCS